MRTILAILLLVVTVPAFSQKMSKPKPILPIPMSTLDQLSIDQLKELQKQYSSKALATPQQKPDPSNDNIPNALRDKIQQWIWTNKGNNIYESNLDGMRMLAPDSSINYSMPNALGGRNKILLQQLQKP